MSDLWKLPRDILHSVYGEWLEWKDLSRLDVACLGKSIRKVWLNSLTDLRLMTGKLTNEYNAQLSGNTMKILYKWLESRRVFCVGDFLLSLDIIQDLVKVLNMDSFCPVLRSIEIRRLDSYKNIRDYCQLENSLIIFLSHCHSLQGVTIWADDNDRYFAIVLQVLTEKLKENSLVQFSLRGVLKYHKSQVMIANLFRKHTSSLQHFNVDIIDGIRIDDIFFTLTENKIHLRVLKVDIGYRPSQSIASMIPYISSAGYLLENLEIHSHVNTDDLVISLATSCPKLIRLVIFNDITCSMENLRLLLEQCPHLQHLLILGTIHMYFKRMSVSIEVKGSNEDWIICLSHALRRRQCRRVILRLGEDYYHPVENLKCMLEPYEIRLETDAPEAPLISLMQNLPHLDSLHLSRFFVNQYTDIALVAMTDHAKTLRDLLVAYDCTGTNNDGFRRCDMFLSELIQTCQLLQSLKMACCGLESLVAVSKHPCLRLVEITVTDSISKEMLDGLLLDEKVTWPSSLLKGSVRSCPYRFSYRFNKKSRHWTKWRSL
eukprot:scaffold2028_cov181-Ochromonas_danica.AAC.1